MAATFIREAEIEYWLAPFTGTALLPGYRRVHLTETRLFWNTYWQLLSRGYSEQELADHAMWWVVAHRPLPYEASFVLAMLDTGKQIGVDRPDRFCLYKGVGPFSPEDWAISD